MASGTSMKQPQSITLSNDVVTLIPMTMDYAQAFYEAGIDDIIWKWVPPHKCASLETAKEWVAFSLEQVAKGDQVMFGIIDNASGKFVGSTRYCSIDVQNSGIEIGYTFVNPQFQRSHINSNAKLLLLTHAFETLGAVRVQLRTHEKNQKSRNAISRLGLNFEGILRHHRLLSTGEYRDTALFSLLHNEWAGAKSRLKNRIADRSVEEKPNTVELSDDVMLLMKEYPLAQIIIASNDNLHDQIIYLPLRLDKQKQRLTGHMSVKNKLAWLLDNSPKVTVVFQGDDAYISPLVHERQVVPTWNYRRVHISGKFRFLSPTNNKESVALQVKDFEDERWSIDDQPQKLMETMLANIRCFDIEIARLDTQFKLGASKPRAVQKAIADELMANGQSSLAAAHSE
jgi:predicted FMN-binding regulatory protein PaiB/RimJ/RimL family protein N-acetyltransferase